MKNKDILELQPAEELGIEPSDDVIRMNISSVASGVIAFAKAFNNMTKNDEDYDIIVSRLEIAFLSTSNY